MVGTAKVKRDDGRAPKRPYTDNRTLLLPRTLFLKSTFPNFRIPRRIVKGLCSEEKRLTCSLTKTYDYERYGVPHKAGNRWYYSYNEGLKPQSVYYSLDDDSIDSKAKGTVFFDPNTLSDDGTLAVHPLRNTF